jgi:hypothetical protein
MHEPPRLRRRPRTSRARGPIARLWQHRACRIGFLIGFAGGVIGALGLAQSRGPGRLGAAIDGSEDFASSVKTASVLP